MQEETVWRAEMMEPDIGISVQCTEERYIARREDVD